MKWIFIWGENVLNFSLAAISYERLTRNYWLYQRKIKILISVILMVKLKTTKKLLNQHTPVPVVILHEQKKEAPDTCGAKAVKSQHSLTFQKTLGQCFQLDASGTYTYRFMNIQITGNKEFNSYLLNQPTTFA